MNKEKLLNIASLWFLFVMLANTPVFAERECTRQVTGSGGDRDITIDCSSTYSQTEEPGAENFQNAYFFRTIVNNLMDNVNWGLENLQDRLNKVFTDQAHSKEIASDMREKEQEAIDTQQEKQQDQESLSEDLKERQAMQLQQQQDAMQNLRDKQE